MTGGITFTYDKNGNLVTRHTPTGDTTHAYDEENRRPLALDTLRLC